MELGDCMSQKSEGAAAGAAAAVVAPPCHAHWKNHWLRTQDETAAAAFEALIVSTDTKIQTTHNRH